MAHPSLLITALLLVLTVIGSLLSTEVVIRLARCNNWLCHPKADRWHQQPTALYGGAAICAAFLAAAAALGPRLAAKDEWDILGIIACGTLIFVLGLRDDIRALNPLVKLVGQVMIVCLFVGGIGLIHPTRAFMLSIPLMVFWVLGLTNAFNLLDNVDGLCAGTAVVCGSTLTIFCLQQGERLLAAMAALVAASALGFLFQNFHLRRPACIFMGDCGSMFLGFTLSALVVAAVGRLPKQPGSMLVEPILIMAVPIFDTTLVTICRRREGRAISQGGRDHSSHRLVYAGLGERQAVFLLWTVGGLSGMGAIYASTQGELNVLAVAALASVTMTCLGCYLSRFREPARPSQPAARLSPAMHRGNGSSATHDGPTRSNWSTGELVLDYRPDQAGV